MKKNHLLILMIAFFVCGQYSFAQSKKELKIKQQLEEYAATKKLIENGRIVFKVTTMLPYQGSNTQVIGDGVLIEENFLHVSLPFLGNSHVSTINKETNIEFSTDDTIFEVIYNDKKQKIKINFEVPNKTETFNFNMSIYRNGRTSLQVVSNVRTRMGYEGRIEATPQVADN